MDAALLLRSQGWAGPGHALDSRPIPGTNYQQKGHRGLAYDPAKVGNTGNGLVKPLAISQRKDRFGIGKKAHEPAKGSEWWLRGFESALGNIGKSDSERSGTSTPNGAGQVFNDGYMGKHAGLYGYFCRGQVMQGTIKDRPTPMNGIRSRSTRPKRKSDAMDDSPEHSSDSSTAWNEKKRRRKQALKASKIAQTEFETVGAFFAERDKSATRRRNREAKTEAEPFAAADAYFAIRDKDKNEQKKKVRDKPSCDAHGPIDAANVAGQPHTEETREERRERRRQRRRKLEADLAQQASLASRPLPGAPSGALAATDRKKRKADRTKKAER